MEASLLSMTNEMLSACPSGNFQVYLQTELEEAGLQVDEVEEVSINQQILFLQLKIVN